MINKFNKLLIFLFFLLIIAVPACYGSDVDQNITSLADTSECQQLSDLGSVELSSGDDEILKDYNDRYFDSSAVNDGSGTKDSPYKYLDSSRVGENNYFAPGTYNVNSPLSSVFSFQTSGMNFIGEDRETTVIQYTGSDAFITTSNDVSFYGITLKGANIVSTGGLVSAKNSIFDSGKAQAELEADNKYHDNSYGGAIKQRISSSGFDWGSIFGSSSARGILIDNCIFRNNFAAYGGAIYAEGSSVNITNSRFEKNHATNYGGAIAALNKAKLIINNCEFEGDYSHYDAGGAIYLFNQSEAKISGNTFNNCLATAGSAIASLNSNINVQSSNFNFNNASWNGGAIYAMYGTLTSSNSNFYNNCAKNGGAVFADNLTYFEVNGGIFSSNMAIDTAGAIFAFANKVNNINNPSYLSNKANKEDDLYQSDKIDLIIANDDNELMIYQSSYNGVLPSKFDLRTVNGVTPVKDQGQSGNCWAFATIATIESAILKATGKQYSLSEGNLKNLAQRFSDIGWNYETNEGGNYQMALGYLTSWAGPVNASLDPTDDWDVFAPILNSVIHIQNILFIQRTGYTDNNAIKEALMKYGAIASEIYWSNSYLKGTSDYYYDGDYGRNHAICVVGWDDTRSISGAPGKGAWIIKNSYGTNVGDNGFYYVSYYDKTLFKLNDASYNSYAIILNDTVKYNKNYQYDAGFTDYFMTGADTLWYKNTFTSTGNDILSAFSTYFNRVTNWEAKIYVNDVLRLTQSGKSNFGYYTIPLSESIPLKIGDKFTISLKINSRGRAEIPISESVTITRDYGKPGVSFFSNDGETWTDLYGYSYQYGSGETGHVYYSQVACLKAFTTEGAKEILNTTVSILTVNSSGVVVEVLDQNKNRINTGRVSFNIDGNIYASGVSNGIASLKVDLKPGSHSITANYMKNEYYNSSTISQNVAISKNNLIISIIADNITYGDDLSINVVVKNTAGEVVDVPLNIEIDNKNYNLSQIKISSLKPGDYIIKVNTLQNAQYNPISVSKVINVAKKSPVIHITVSDVSVGDKLNIYAEVENITGTVSVNIAGKTEYVSVKNGKGSLTADINLSAGQYVAKAEFSGDELYLNGSADIKFNVNKRDVSLKISDADIVEGQTANIKVTVPSDISDDLVLYIGGKSYTSAPQNGVVTFNIANLSAGNYEYSISFNGNEKYASKSVKDSIKVSKKSNNPTISAKDMTRAYLSGKDFEATFFDKSGNKLANKDIKFQINGKVYSVKTNSYGIAKLNAKLPVGVYKIIIKNVLTGEQLTKSIKIVKRITENKNLVMDYLDGSSFKVRVYGDNGKAVGAGEIVKFKVSGKTYSVKTNKNGYAMLKINLPPKKYSITTEYRGVKVSNNILVKPVLKASSVTHKKSKSIKFSASLKNSKGKAIVGKSVTFKINGKTYHAKTNKYGFAIIYLKNLKVGKYNIVSVYAKSSVKNIIKINR